jgi:alkylation response protein AidB-like acyl-CoA dehydrogenase
VDWPRDFLWSRAESIFSGANEIQRNIIAKRVLNLPQG